MFEMIVDVVSRAGYAGVFLLMLLENIFPPIPSELIMPLAGFVAAKGELNIYGVVVAGTAGSVAGALPWYYAGAWLGKDRLMDWTGRHGYWLTMCPEDIEKANQWFGRHGRSAVFFGRLLPTIRTLISVPAGLARMPMTGFIGYSTAGSLIWTALLALAGFILEAQYEKVADYVDPVSIAVVAIVAMIYVYRLVRLRLGQRN